MDAHSTVALVRLADTLDVRVWVAGGWGIDALIGEQTRSHDDLDLAVDTVRFEDFVDALMQGGFEIDVNWMPVRLQMRRGDGAVVDLRPVSFGSGRCGVHESLDGVQYLYPRRDLTFGTIAGHRVPCLSAMLQLGFHLGYAPSEQDRSDMAALAAATGVELREPYE